MNRDGQEGGRREGSKTEASVSFQPNVFFVAFASTVESVIRSFGLRFLLVMFHFCVLFFLFALFFSFLPSHSISARFSFLSHFSRTTASISTSMVLGFDRLVCWIKKNPVAAFAWLLLFIYCFYVHCLALSFPSSSCLALHNPVSSSSLAASSTSSSCSNSPSSSTRRARVQLLEDIQFRRVNHQDSRVTKQVILNQEDVPNLLQFTHAVFPPGSFLVSLIPV